MDEKEFRSILALGHEQSGIEFKGPGSRDDKPFFVKIVRAMLGMANHRDGGRIFIGVGEDENKTPIPVGLSDDQAGSWNYDILAESVHAYADPSVEFHVERFSFETHGFVFIDVQEFDDIPVLCKKSYNDVLREGACYVRTRRKPETSEIPTQADMRDLLDLATDKRLRRFVGQAARAGLAITSDNSQNLDSDRFGQQLKDFLE